MLFREVPKKIILTLLEIGEMNINDLTKEIDSSYSHVYNVIKEMNKKNIIKVDKKGREKILFLSDKGKKIAEKILEIEHILNKAHEKDHKLFEYKEKLESIRKIIEKKKIKDNERKKLLRKIGFYRWCISMHRSKNSDLKQEILKLIDELKEILSSEK